MLPKNEVDTAPKLKDRLPLVVTATLTLSNVTNVPAFTNSPTLVTTFPLGSETFSLPAIVCFVSIFRVELFSAPRSEFEHLALV